ncbi:hypothetical protein HMJ29_16880 [Hymenobacter taeanensis]|uniref:DUF3108 domain-containing protein n=1 Tax=Hymenobacter taeanensis TaxID=2735321 RepID=A0A6M6BKX1_9BACT|nr:MULTISPECIES: hypothetical protein [Hymenobacter]QJX48498.1 hypothetical protein HMJ29_16880 [Hymenobacter taeanensis]UOQ82005.1 hypothetical protein MUN83_04240 [Hymenobacter sp. 5414T-23]
MTSLSRFLSFASTLVLTAGSALAQQQPAADARPFGLTDRMEIVYQLQDGKGKPVGVIRNRVVNFTTEQNKKQTITTTTALLKSGMYDTKNKLENLQDLRYMCRQDTCFTDGTSELNAESLSSFRNRLFTYDPVPLAWPNHPTVGSTLPSGGVTVQVSSTAVDIAKVYATVKNRKVVSGQEPVTTPAGTFQCYKVESEREHGTAARADLIMRSSQRVVDYYSPEIGMVKSEFYDKKGNLEQVRLLTMRNGSSAQATEPLHQKVKTKLK